MKRIKIGNETYNYPEGQETKWVVRLLWSSNKDDPNDYYADKLELLRDGDDKMYVRFSCGGEVMIKQINPVDYV